LREDAPAPMEDEVSRWAFKQLKLALQVVPIHRTPNWNKPFLVYCDASREAVGGTLSQLDEKGHDHPIHFASRQLISAEKNYTVIEHEGLVLSMMPCTLSKPCQSLNSIFCPMGQKIRLLNTMIITLTNFHKTNPIVNLPITNNSLQVNKFEQCDNL
jgi:hypothetical protein